MSSRARLFAALDTPPWWDNGDAAVNEAIAGAGFSVSHHENVSPEHQEWDLLDRSELVRELAVLGRLHRLRARFEEEIGVVWYERWRAWMAWAPYLLLGKLQTVAWVLKKP